MKHPIFTFLGIGLRFFCVIARLVLSIISIIYVGLFVNALIAGGYTQVKMHEYFDVMVCTSLAEYMLNDFQRWLEKRMGYNRAEAAS
jgi:hypothetical protein